MPRGFDHDIRKQVDMNVDQGDGSYPKGRCIHCEKIIAVTASTIKRHLKGCAAYEKHRAEHPELHPESTELTPRRSLNKTPKTPKAATNAVGGVMSGTMSGTPSAGGAGAVAAAPINMNSEQGLRAAQFQAAIGIYVGGHPFKLFASPEMRELFRMLSPSFRAPTEEDLAGELLDGVYDEYLKRVRQIFDGMPWLNITLVEAENPGDQLVFNVCVNPGPGTFYYWTRINTGDIEITAANRLQLLRPVLADITGGNLSRVMSYTMSTERVFGEANFHYCPVRNRLPEEKLQKLLFIYYNHRVLKQKQKSWPQLTEVELEEMENMLFQH